MVHNLSFPPRQSVNDGIKPDTYLDAPFKLHLPGLDKLVEFVNLKGVGCLVFKKDLTQAYQKIPVHREILQRNISVFLNGYCVIYHCQNH